jgi:hypothetical protein
LEALNIIRYFVVDPKVFRLSRRWASREIYLDAPKKIVDLVERLENSHESYKDVHHNETQVRREFVDQFFSTDQVVKAKEEDYEC